MDESTMHEHLFPCVLVNPEILDSDWLKICTRICCIYFVFMTLANLPSLQMWPELDAVSLGMYMIKIVCDQVTHHTLLPQIVTLTVHHAPF